MVVVLAGCGETTINTGKGERFITKEVETQLGAKVKSVKCPSDVEPKKGGTFDCTVTGDDGTKGIAKVTQKDAKGNVRFIAPFVSNRNGEAFITRQVEAQVGAVVQDARCPEIVTFEKGGVYECEVTGADGTTGPVTVTQKDAQGNVRIDAPFVHVRNLENLMAGDIGRQVGSAVELTCPEIVVGSKGATFDCDAVSGKDRTTVKVTQKDDKGNVNYKLQGQ